MSRRHYPRYDSRRALSPRTSLRCQYATCEAQAKWRIFVQVTYMRGDDEDCVVCDEHRKFPEGHDNLDNWYACIVSRPAPERAAQQQEGSKP